ncbi:MAG: hypothetical protein DPW09_18805 [Anaerolineae bacterium]|nr:hypothetical protein [Anaerolineales bacterium]MCQ3975491.1 hypothetical protein [Anaerolineae bacterium]
MTVTTEPTIDIAARRKQLVELTKNLHILQERQAKYGGNAPLELLNQIQDHYDAINLLEQALAGQLSAAELEEALKPLLLALRDGQVVNITAETYVAGDQVIQNITQLAARALTAAEEAEKAQEVATRRLAQGVRDYALRLQEIAADESDTATGNPYKGLEAYRLCDAELFYGRDQVINELLARLQHSRLTILHAESGAGKSSLLQAGISPRLLAQGHLPVHLRPYNRPPGLVIKQAFLPDLSDMPELAQARLRDFLRRVTGVLGQQAALYLFLDQFEEIFTLTDELTRTAFVEELAECLDDESLNVRWVFSLRTEFFGAIANFRPTLRNPFENDFRLNRFNRAETETVITTPAERRGISFEPALVEALFTDLRDPDSDEVSPAQLQLICSALYTFFCQRREAAPDLPPVITLQMYHVEGQAKGILRNHLNRVLRTTATKAEREAARQLLMALVSSDQRRIRRTKSELETALADDRAGVESLDKLLDHLIENRLLNVEKDEQTDQPTYELAHDYLLVELRLDPETQTRRAAEELLKQEVAAYKRYGSQALLNAEKFAIINSQRQFLRLDDEAQEFLRRSQIAVRRVQLQWYGLIAAVVLLIIGAAVAIAIFQGQAAQERTFAAATAQAGAAQAQLAQATALAEAARALNAQSTAQAEANRALLAESNARVQVNRVTLAQATAQAEKVIAESNAAEAQRQANLANARQLTSDAQNVLAEKPEQALLLLFEAKRLTQTLEVERAMGQVPYRYFPMKATLSGHTAWVNSVAWSPDGKQLASASDDQTIIIWDVASDQPVLTLEGHTDMINNVAWSPDGKQLASASFDQTIIIWDVATGQQVTVLSGHSDAVLSVAWSPDGKQLASASSDQTVILWDVTTDKLITRLSSHTNPVVSVAWSPDGQRLASAAEDQTVIVWDVAARRPVMTLRDHKGIVYKVAWSPDGQQLASASEDETVIIWNAQTGQAQKTLRGHTSWVFDVAWSPDGQQLASASQDQTVIIWDVATSQPVATLHGHSDRVTSIAWSPDGQQLASASADQTIIIWDVTRGPIAVTLRGHTGPVIDVAWSPNGQQLASTSHDQSIIIWDAATMQPKRTLLGHTDSPITVAWRPDGRQLASASLNETIIWDAVSGQPQKTLTDHTSVVDDVAWSPDGRQLASASFDQTVIIWDAVTGQPQKTLATDNSEAVSVAWSPDGQQLASALANQTIILWDTSTWQQLTTLYGHKNIVTDVAWSPDGRQLASASEDQTIILWDAATHQLKNTLHGHTDWITRLVWSPDGKKVASASADQTVIIWDVGTGQRVAVLQGHSDQINSLAWSPNGQRLASASYDRTIRLINTRFVQPSCRWVTRNLNAAEWATYLPAGTPYHRTCPNRPIHPSLIEAARDLARAGQIDEAIAQFQHLLTVDPTLDLDPQAEAQQAYQEAVQSLLAQAREEAQTGDVEAARATLEQAVTLDPTLILDPQAEAQRLAQPTFENSLAAAVKAAKDDDMETAQAKFEEAEDLAGSLESAKSWQALCDAGTRHGLAETVLDACDKAIELEPDNGLYYNSRGIARLQVGDQQGAQEDFAKFEAWLEAGQSEP